MKLNCISKHKITAKISGIVLMFALTVCAAFGQTPTPTLSPTPSPSPTPAVELKLNEPIERELSKGQTHEYQITLKAGEFMNIQIEEKGIVVDAGLSLGQGESYLTILIPPKGQTKNLIWIAEKDGIYKVKIYPSGNYKNETGKYLIKLIEQRPPNGLDEQKMKAVRTTIDGVLAFNNYAANFTKDNYDEVIKKLDKATNDWRDLRDDAMVQSLTNLLRATKLLSKFFEFAMIAGQDTPEDLQNAVKGLEELKLKFRELDNNESLTGLIFDLQGGIYVKLGNAEKATAYYNQALIIYRLAKDVGEENNILDKIKNAPNDARKAAARLRRSNKKKSNSASPQLRVSLGHSDLIDSVVFSPDGKMLASGSADKTIKLWDVATGRELRTISTNGNAYSVVFSPNGQILAGVGENTFVGEDVNDEVVILWDVATGSELRKLFGHGENIYSIAFSPDGSLLVSGSGDHTVRLWDVKTGKGLRILAGHDRDVNSVAFSPDGKLLASGSADDNVKIWDAETGKEKITLKGHYDDITSVAFSRDGSFVASGSEDDTVKIWNVADGKEIGTLIGHLDNVNSVAFSPNGKLLASGSRDSKVKLWNIETGDEIRTFVGADGSLSVAFSSDGKMLASGNQANENRFVECGNRR